MIYRLIHADVMAGLAQLADGSAQCVVTSPPYWGLRDYGIEPSVWGGDPSCAHEFGEELRPKRKRHASDITNSPMQQTSPASVCEAGGGNLCAACGAWRGCFGLEPTPELYVEHAVFIFREVFRVLRDDGTLWLNMGDSYTDSGRGSDVGSTLQGTRQNQQESRKTRVRETTKTGLRPKNLVGMPWRVAFALQADGWYLRSEIIWSKPNPMPESVTDRPTKAHEQIFLLAKRERYFYDAEAIKEPMSASVQRRPELNEFKGDRPDIGGTSRTNGRRGAVRKFPAGWDAINYGRAEKTGRYLTPKGNAKTFRGGGAYTGNRAFDNDGEIERDLTGNVPNETGMRNKRSVWTVATAPFPGAHFATFPPDLIEPCILAGSRVGDVVLDPFNGSGTTGIVALSHQRDYFGIELNGEYVAMSERRLAAVAPMFAKPYTSTNVTE